MKIYLASSWRNERQPAVLAALREAGHEVYDFRNPEPGNHGFSWSAIDPNWKEWTSRQFRTALDHEVAQDGYLLDMEALQGADATVMLAPCGRSAHLELGFAAGAGQFTAVLLEGQNEPELMLLAANVICLTIDEVIEELDIWDKNGIAHG